MADTTEYTMVKQDFPNDWEDDTTMDLLVRLLSENGFKITGTKEISANEMVLDARPHTDIYTIEKDGRTFRFQLNATTDLRRDKEHVDSIDWLTIGMSSKPVKEVQYVEPPDSDVDRRCAAIEYWVRDLTNYVSGKPVEKRQFNHKYWNQIRHEEYLRIKAESEARWQDYLKHPDKYFGPPIRLVEPQLYDAKTVAVVPTTEPVGLAFALNWLEKDKSK